MPINSKQAQEFAGQLARALDVPCVLVLTQQSDGSVCLASHGFATHAHINEVLSVGIHANLTDHDRHVLAGAAGEEAAAVARSIINS